MVADRPSEDWDAYWRGMHKASAYGAGGVQQGTLDRFWQDLFRQLPPLAEHSRILDLACGHGAVARHAIEVAKSGTGPAPTVYGLDISAAAIAELSKNVPEFLGVAASAAQTPFVEKAFDVVASQFGLEYAGPAAFAEALRLVAPKGTFAGVVHMKFGAIYRECTLNVDVANEIIDGGVLSRARNTFAAGFAVRDRNGSMNDFKKASEDLVPAVRGLGDIMRKHGPQVAGGTARSLHEDITHMYRRLNAYYGREVLDWLTGMERELGTYVGRMQSMLDVAIDEAEFKRVIDHAVRQGFSIRTEGSIRLDRSPDPAAWVLVAQAG